METFAIGFLSKNTMEIKEIIQDIQTNIDRVQSKLNLLKTVQTGQLYEVDVLMTRKEAAHFIHKSERQLDRLCAERKIKREYIDGAVRIRKNSLLRYMGLEILPVTQMGDAKSEFERIMEKYR
nr:MAG TPA: Protein of unknown function (DUF3853) [Caudoviricetes sp.]